MQHHRRRRHMTIRSRFSPRTSRKGEMTDGHFQGRKRCPEPSPSSAQQVQSFHHGASTPSTAMATVRPLQQPLSRHYRAGCECVQSPACTTMARSSCRNLAQPPFLASLDLAFRTPRA
jgi:hypothetical protein